MPDLTLAPNEVVRALKGDKDLQKNFPGDYYMHGQWKMYPPNTEMEKDPSLPLRSFTPSPSFMPSDWMHNKVGALRLPWVEGLFGTPPKFG